MSQATTTTPATTTTAATTTTQAPTTAPVSASGDPHLTNVRGERFDLLQPGKHIFLQIPRKSLPQDALLHVMAEVQKAGVACGDMYIQALNVTGKWAEAKHTGGFQYFAKVELKIVRGHTIEGINYLNIFANKLGQVGYP